MINDSSLLLQEMAGYASPKARGKGNVPAPGVKCKYPEQKQENKNF